MFYVGNTFDEKANKGYKTIQNAKKAAEKDGLSVWDEEGVKLYPLKVEVTDDVPDDAALEEKPDGSVNAYDETGEKVGEVSAEEVKEIMDEITAEDVKQRRQQPETKKKYMERSAECLKEDFAFAEDLRLKTMRFVA